MKTLFILSNQVIKEHELEIDTLNKNKAWFILHYPYLYHWVELFNWKMNEGEIYKIILEHKEAVSYAELHINNLFYIPYNDPITFTQLDMIVSFLQNKNHTSNIVSYQGEEWDIINHSNAIPFYFKKIYINDTKVILHL